MVTIYQFFAKDQSVVVQEQLNPDWKQSGFKNQILSWLAFSLESLSF